MNIHMNTKFISHSQKVNSIHAIIVLRRPQPIPLGHKQAALEPRSRAPPDTRGMTQASGHHAGLERGGRCGRLDRRRRRRASGGGKGDDRAIPPAPSSNLPTGIHSINSEKTI